MFGQSRKALIEWCAPRSLRQETGLSWIVEQAFLGKPDEDFWWVGPDFGAVLTIMNALKSSLTPGSYKNLSRSTALTLMNGANLWFRSAENTAQMYSDSVNAILIDQAIQIEEKNWKPLNESIALSGAKTRILSTCGVKSHWFHQLAREKEQEQNLDSFLSFVKFTASDAIEVGFLTADDVSYAKNSLPDHIFRAMYDCEPYNPQIEAAHSVGDPRLMTDEELAVIAGIDPEISTQDLENLVLVSQ